MTQSTASSTAPDLGALPEWDLRDLYPSMESAEFADDLAKAASGCSAFAATYRGQLAATLEGAEASEALGEAVRKYEELQDLLGRIMSYAGLVYTGNTTDPIRAKFFGDAQEKVTEYSSDLLFFQLELNRLDDALLEQAVSQEPLSHWRPWIEDIRKDKPYELSDDLEKLFHEKSVTGHAAWNRLFDETIASLRFEVDGSELTLEPVLSLMQDRDGATRRKAAEVLAKVLRENLRPFTLITNTLAKDKEISDRWRGFEDVADSRHLSNRIEREVVDALVAAVRQAYPRLSHRYYRLKASWFGVEALDFWDRNAPLPDTVTKVFGWTEARTTVLDAYGAFSPRMADIARDFFDRRWIDAPVRPGKAPSTLR